MSFLNEREKLREREGLIAFANRTSGYTSRAFSHAEEPRL